MSKYNYYTPIELAALLLELIPQKASISSAIDICCGSWNLLAAAKRHYPEVKITGVDIDPAAHAHCIEGATFVCDDGRSFANRQEKAKQTYDLVLSNPPFGPLSKKKKKYRNANADETTQNILQRDFYATAPNQKWATDVTEFKVPGKKKKLYLSAIIDLYDRYPVAYVVSARNDNRLIFKTFDKAIAANPDAKPIFHSDRGFQYTSKTFRKKLENQEMEQSMSRVGHCIDNGPIEGFWGIIKSEMYQMYEITDESSLRFAIKDYIRFYSEERPQDRYCCKTPLEVRQEALKSDIPVEYPIPENKRIKKYKEKWCA